MAKQSKNLSLDPDVIERAERYSELHNTNVSQLVSRFLASLPLGWEGHEDALTPAVRRLLGAGGAATADDYHKYLLEKYGR